MPVTDGRDMASHTSYDGACKMNRLLSSDSVPSQHANTWDVQDMGTQPRMGYDAALHQAYDAASKHAAPSTYVPFPEVMSASRSSSDANDLMEAGDEQQALVIDGSSGDVTHYL